ncbi:MAG: rhomboid family intramembrane serine protease [Flavobacteriaceae bacterium]|tara:strand:+ start:30495 stop:31139 length:645 start_codon:yes stop_codon:yes gene_type:complete
MLGISNLLFSLILTIVLISLNALKNYSIFEKFKLNVGKVNSGEYYRLLSSGFLHGDIQHLLFNCFTLFIFGDTVIMSLGEINFVLLYFSSLIFSGWLSVYFNKKNSFYSAVGASGAVIGVVYSSILLYPGMKLAFLFFPIPMPAYLFAIGYLLYSLYGVKKLNDGIGHEAHVGGALSGLIITSLFKPNVITESFYLLIVMVAITVIGFFSIKKN